MTRARQILFLLAVAGWAFPAWSADNDFPLQKQPGQKEVRTIQDLATAEKQLEGLNNAVSNAMQIAAETKRAEETTRGVFESVVIAAVLLGVGIFLFRKFAPNLGGVFNVRMEADTVSTAHAEEKSFSEFAAAFKVGPTPGRQNAPAEADDLWPQEPLRPDERSAAVPLTLKAFFEGAPKTVSILRNLIQEITRAPEGGSRHKLLENLSANISSLKCMAGVPQALPVWQLAAALEGLVRQLLEKNRNVTASTLRTVASAVDLLEALSVPGIRPDLSSNPPIRFLAVDDDSISRHAVCFALKKALNKPDVAENGEAALALASHIKYDAIFLDVQMPGMDGYETCSKIHATELNRATPVVFVTCQSDFDARAKSTLSGGIDLIGKPYLTFEITVKALTLALRGRLQGPQLLGKSAIELNIAEAAKVSLNTQTRSAEQEQSNGRSAGTSEATGSSASSTAVRKSREERRRDRRKRAQAIRERKNRKARREPANSHNGTVAQPDAASLSLSTDVVANAFLAHAPANIQTLQERLDHFTDARNDAERQEVIVDLYLAVHSLSAEAKLAKLDTIFLLSSALETLFKKLVEEPKSSMASAVELAEAALDLLNDFCETRPTANLNEPPIRILLATDDPVAQTISLPSVQMELATASAQALVLTIEKQFDVIFLDAHVSGADGVSLGAKIRRTATNGTTPIVLLASPEELEAQMQSDACDSDDLILKPIDPVEANLTALALGLRARLEQFEGKEAESADAAAVAGAEPELAESAK